MRLPSLKALAASVLVLGSLGLVAGEVLASTPTVKGKGKVFEHIQEIVTLNSVTLNNDILTVPAKQTLVITDVIVTNNGGTANQFSLRCLITGETPVDLLPPIPVASDGSFSHSFSAGLECSEGFTLRAVADTASSAFKATLVGYYRKGT